MVAASLLFAARPAAAELVAVWAIDDGTKVKADALDHPLAARNGTFDGTTIELFGARNETVAFQVILEGGAAPTDDVTVRLDAVGAIENGATTNDPDSYFLHRNIELFEQIYLQIDQRSRGLVWETNGEPDWPEIPRGLDGPVPDPLVPLNIRDGGLTVPAARNQGIWIDVYIPKSTPPGVQRGTVEVLVGGQPCALPTCRLPVELTVVNATLPDEPPVKTMLYFSCHDGDTCLERYYDDPWDVDPTPLQQRHYKLFRRHLITGFIGNDAEPNDELRARLSGEAFTAAQGYDGWGAGRGQDVYSIGSYGQKLTQAKAQQWHAWLQANAAAADYFSYVWDEPGRGSFGEVNARAATVAPLPAFVTVPFSEELDEVDIFCTYADDYDQERFDAGRAAGKRMWIYNGTRPASGSFATDDTAVSTRVNPWIQYRFNIQRWFYWESTYYRDLQGGRRQTDLFSNPMTFNDSPNRINGDGVLVYPGRDRIYPEQDRGFEHPLPSIRLKNWRRGIQDIAYLQFAAQVDPALRDAALRAIVPKALDETTNNSEVSWPDSGEPWLEQRRKVAMLFLVDPPPGGPAPPPAGGGGSGREPGQPGPGTTYVYGSCAVAAGGAGQGAGLLALLALLALLRGASRARGRDLSSINLK